MNSEDNEQIEQEIEEEKSEEGQNTEEQKVPEDPIEKLKKESEEKPKIIEDWKKKYMLLQAEFENYQKRMDKNRAHIRDIERASVLKSFLKIADTFEKAIEHIETNQSSDKGDVKSIYNQIINQFKSYKVEKIPTSKGDLFDYKIHEAISNIENPDLPENSIFDIIQSGWKIENEILRYVKVVISKLPKEPEPEPEPEQQFEEVEEEKQAHENLCEDNNSEKKE